MNSGLAQRKSTASANFFRADWTYRRNLPAGAPLAAAGRGMSPAFFALLGLIEPQQPVSFGELGQSLAWLHADDLELWLAELCRMGLIEPGSGPAAVPCRAEPAVVRPQFRAELQFEAPPQNPRAVLPNPQADDLDFCRMGSTEPRSEASASTAAPCRAWETGADAPAVPSRAVRGSAAGPARRSVDHPGRQLRQGLETGQPGLALCRAACHLRRVAGARTTARGAGCLNFHSLPRYFTHPEIVNEPAHPVSLRQWPDPA